ncbi:hypothetical protein B7486_67905, partial [cyanobacterium TDX16]
DGEWTGCLRLEPGGVERCGDPDAELATYESGEGATFGAIGDGEQLVFVEGDRSVDLIDGRFFVVASDAEVRLEP